MVMKPNVIYNVLIGGYSIGMTFSLPKAMTWLHKSMYKGNKVVRAVRYTEPNNLTIKVDYGS